MPMIGCGCRTCTSTDPRDRRTNASALLRAGDVNILIDCGRDFRDQALRLGLRRVDHVLLTHIHHDHIAGIDDLRAFTSRTRMPMPVYGKDEHLAYIRDYSFRYLFDPGVQAGGGVASLDLRPLDGPLELAGVRFEPVPLIHGSAEILGYRFLDCAYLSDVSSIPEPTVRRLGGLRVLIIDGLRYRPHVSHYSVTEALAMIARLAPERAFLTHMSHDVLHSKLARELREGRGDFACPVEVEPGYDGLVLDLEE